MVEPANSKFNIKEEYELDVSTIYEREKQLTNLEEQIKQKRDFLLDKRKTLVQAKEQNKFLKDVQQDYQKYYQYIVDEKQRQTEAFTKLNEHLDRIIVSGQLTEKEVEQSKKDQKTILKELDGIKRGLNNIMEESK
jgi:predicted esterase YcpF (UPF0227 family)